MSETAIEPTLRVSPPIRIRGVCAADVPFLTNSWLRSYAQSRFAQDIPNRVFYWNHHKLIEQVVPRSTVLVACAEDDPDQIYGYLAFELVDTALVIHYCFVKKDFRGFGIAQALYDHAAMGAGTDVVFYTHQTKYSVPIAVARKWIYNPYLLFVDLPKGWEQ